MSTSTKQNAFVDYRNRIKPFRTNVTSITAVDKSQGIANRPTRCLHLRNVDQREMACVNMRNRSMFRHPTPTQAYNAYEPTEVPLYLRNSGMVIQHPHLKDARPAAYI